MITYVGIACCSYESLEELLAMSVVIVSVCVLFHHEAPKNRKNSPIPCQHLSILVTCLP